MTCNDAGACTPGEIRTHDLWLRRPTLYPAELRAHLRKKDTPNLLYPEMAVLPEFLDKNADCITHFEQLSMHGGILLRVK